MNEWAFFMKECCLQMNVVYECVNDQMNGLSMNGGFDMCSFLDEKISDL